MLRRTWHLARARLAMLRRSGWPVPAFVFLAALGAALASLVRHALPPFPYALLALSVGGLLLVLPLLSDLGALLRRDEGEEWIASLPALGVERALARALQVLAILGALAASWFVPWVLLAPDGMGAGGRAELLALALAQTVCFASFLIWMQQLLLARLESAFVLFESALVVVMVVVLVELLGHLPELAELAPDRPGLRWFPPAWFALPLARGGWTWCVPAGAAAGALGALLVIPAGRAEPPRGRRWSERWLEPLRRVALRTWVRDEERGAFDLVSLALPREREVALRTYPMLGIPLAFLWISASGEPGAGGTGRGDFLALLLFTAGVFLPLLLTHVPMTASPGAAWLLQTAPCSPADIRGGAIKALFLRYLLPLYGSLLGLGVLLSETQMLLRLWLPALLLSLLLLRLLYPRCVRGLPLSVAPEELRSELDWAGLVATLAVALTLAAVLANRYLGWRGGLCLALALGACELALGRRGPGAGAGVEG